MHIKATCRRNALSRTVYTARKIFYKEIRSLSALFLYPDPEFDIRDENDERLAKQTEYAIFRVGGPIGRD